MRSFREKLIPTAPVLLADDYNDAETLMTSYPNLVLCIVYVTSRYLPGYQELQAVLEPSISSFLQFLLCSKAANGEEEFANMQALITLYIFTRLSTVERNDRSKSSSGINFWSIKSTCEVYAVKINLHRAVQTLEVCWRSGTMPSREDKRIKLYLCWLWLFTICHEYAGYSTIVLEYGTNT
jgi:hypothetical protein